MILEDHRDEAFNEGSSESLHTQLKQDKHWHHKIFLFAMVLAELACYDNRDDGGDEVPDLAVIVLDDEVALCA